MPLVEAVQGRGKAIVQEFGCGHYGCVMPTSTPGVVVKLSSDPTEAYFVAAALQLGFEGYDDAGIVRYYGVYQLRNAYHRKRPIFVIWREEAFDIGFPLAGAANWRQTSDYEIRRNRKLSDYLDAFKGQADSVRRLLNRAAKRGEDPYDIVAAANTREMQEWAWGSTEWDERATDVRIMGGGRGVVPSVGLPPVAGSALYLRACAIIAEMMENTDGSDTIGRTLGYYLNEGLLLADVHANNVGKVERHDDIWDGEVRVITDPGHAVPLEPRWREVVIEEI